MSATSSRGSSTGCFNGAARINARKFPSDHATLTRTKASMGPRELTRGNVWPANRLLGNGLRGRFRAPVESVPKKACGVKSRRLEISKTYGFQRAASGYGPFGTTGPLENRRDQKIRPLGSAVLDARLCRRRRSPARAVRLPPIRRRRTASGLRRCSFAT